MLTLNQVQGFQHPPIIQGIAGKIPFRAPTRNGRTKKQGGLRGKPALTVRFH
jgi:hypothetical protein